MTTLTEARRRFAQERPDYRRLAADVEHELQQILAGAGVAGQVTGRAKDLHSFVSKSLRKGYTDPWTQTTDKAGVRITLTREAAIDIVVQLVTERYTVLEIQDKRRDLLREDKIGYMGVHVQVEVPGQDSVARQCEIQVRTAAQNLWAEMSHELLYKPEARPDAETGRALTRLAVYMETFDEEVNRRVTQLLAAPGYPLERLISAAEQEYYRFATAPGDRALSRRLLEGIGPALPADQDVAMYTRQLTAFTDAQHDKLDHLFGRYQESDGVLLLTQPESIVILERLDADPYSLADVWATTFPIDELDSLASAWGGPL